MAKNPYYHNGKYSPKKAQREAVRKYATGTPEYRKEIDEIGCVVWGVIIAICAGIFFTIVYFKGVDSAIDWLE